MSSSLALRVVKVARASSLFTKSRYPLFRPTSPVVAPFVGLKRDFTAPSLLLHAGSSTGSPWAGGHRNFSTKSRKTQSLPSSDEDKDNHVEFISDSSEDDDGEEEEFDVEDSYGGLGSQSLYADVFDPFIHKSSFGQLLQYIDLLKNENQALKEAQGVVSEDSTSKEDEEALYLWVNMPGLGKEDVKVCLEKDVLTMKGERNDDAGGRKFKYCKKVKLPAEMCKVNEIKAEIVNGVLKVVVPKIKEEERKDVIRISVA